MRMSVRNRLFDYVIAFRYVTTFLSVVFIILMVISVGGNALMVIAYIR
jgi:hypothetical protein